MRHTEALPQKTNRRDPHLRARLQHQQAGTPSARIRWSRVCALTTAVTLAACCVWIRFASADQAVVYSTDFATADYSTMDLAAPFSRTIGVETACADAVARTHGDFVYLVGRFGCDNIQVIDSANNFQTILQFSTGNGSNPHDIEVYSPTKAYVSLYDADSLLVVNPQTGQALGAIDLSVFSDADGLPEADEMVLVGDRLFVALQRLDRPGGFVPTNPSFVAVIDCSTDQLVDVDSITPGTQGIALTGRNPFGELRYDPVRQRIVVVETGFFGALDGGIEFIDPKAMQAEGWLITESTLGGDLNTAHLYVDCTGYAVVTDASFNTALARFDHCTGALSQTCVTSSGFNLSDVEISRDGLVYLADRDFVTPGVRVFAAPTCSEITGTPLTVGLPPQDIALVQACQPTSVPASPTTRTVHLLPNQPNPFNPATLVRFEAPAHAPAVIDILDARGRFVSVLWRGTITSASNAIVWHGRDDAGRDLPSGVYIARLRSGATVQTRRMTLLR